MGNKLATVVATVITFGRSRSRARRVSRVLRQLNPPRSLRDPCPSYTCSGVVGENFHDTRRSVVIMARL